MTTIVSEGIPAQVLVEDWPRVFEGDQMFTTAIRCVCTYEVPPHPVPSPSAIGVYSIGILGATLAAYSAGRLRRIRRRYA